MRNRSLGLLFLAFVLALASLKASADMGQIHTSPAEVSEEGQKAIILHNMTDEILILGTDLKASSNTGILRFIPFPSEPEINLAPEKVFDAAAELMKKHELKFLMVSKGGASAQGVELKLHAKLGAHDLSVIKVTDPVEFRDWANTYFRKKNLPEKKSYPEVEEIVKDYVKRDIPYFVLDYVELTPETKFIEPVMYRFKSPYLYYPLKTTNSFGGQGSIDIILITPRTLCQTSLDAYSYSGEAVLGLPAYTQASTSAKITPVELKGILPEAGTFFKEQNIYLQMLSRYGEYKFENDILYDLSKGEDKAYGYQPEGPESLLDEWVDSLENDPK
jgi:hypothetical protein